MIQALLNDGLRACGDAQMQMTKDYHQKIAVRLYAYWI